PFQETGRRAIPGGSFEAAARSNSHRVRARPTAPATGSATSPAPSNAIATAAALPSPAVTTQTSCAVRIVRNVSEIRVGGGFGQLRTATTGRSSYTAGESGKI